MENSMTLENIIELMNQDLANELKHFNFYLNAYFSLRGFDRLHFGSWLEKHADEELAHVKMFANKIVALGGIPVTESNSYSIGIENSKDILKFAISMETEVIQNYHTRLKIMQDFNTKTGKYYDLVLFYEEQLEDSQNDLDEMNKML
jgi:bacterioferritin (cytochrome b1)